MQRKRISRYVLGMILFIIGIFISEQVYEMDAGIQRIVVRIVAACIAIASIAIFTNLPAVFRKEKRKDTTPNDSSENKVTMKKTVNYPLIGFVLFAVGFFADELSREMNAGTPRVIVKIIATCLLIAGMFMAQAWSTD